MCSLQALSHSHESSTSPTRAPSRAQMAKIEEWLNHKSHRAVVVSPEHNISDTGYYKGFVHASSSQALPDDPELAEIKQLCQEIYDREQVFFTVSLSTVPSIHPSVQLSRTPRSWTPSWSHNQRKITPKEKCSTRSGVKVCSSPSNPS